MMTIRSRRPMLAFWFGTAQRWYAKDDAFDAEIRLRFLASGSRGSRRSGRVGSER